MLEPLRTAVEKFGRLLNKCRDGKDTQPQPCSLTIEKAPGDGKCLSVEQTRHHSQGQSDTAERQSKVRPWLQIEFGHMMLKQHVTAHKVADSFHSIE